MLERTNAQLCEELGSLTEKADTYRTRAERSERRVEELEAVYRVREVRMACSECCCHGGWMSCRVLSAPLVVVGSGVAAE